MVARKRLPGEEDVKKLSSLRVLSFLHFKLLNCPPARTPPTPRKHRPFLLCRGGDFVVLERRAAFAFVCFFSILWFLSFHSFF